MIEVVAFKLKAGVSPAEFAPIDKAVERDHVAKQPGFVSRESAHGSDGQWLVIAHWRLARDADASMATGRSTEETSAQTHIDQPDSS